MICRATQTDPPLIVDANAVLTLPIALQRLEAIAGQCRKVLYGVRRLKAIEFQSRGPLDSIKRLDSFAACEVSRALVAVADNH